MGITRNSKENFLMFPAVSCDFLSHSCDFLMFPAISLVIPAISYDFPAFPSISLGNARKQQESTGSDDFCPIWTAIPNLGPYDHVK